MVRPTLLALAACLTFVSSGLSSAAPSTQSSVNELLKIAREKEDNVAKSIYGELARHGDEASFRALKQAIEFVEKEENRLAVYRAFALYPEDSDLREKGLDLVAKAAKKSKKDIHERAATKALADFGAMAYPALEGILKVQRDEVCKREAMLTLLPALQERATSDAAHLIIANAAKVRGPGKKDRVRKALAAFPEAEVCDLYVDAIADEDTSPHVQLMLLEAMKTWKSPDSSKSLARLIGKGSQSTRVAAIEAIAAQSEPGAGAKDVIASLARLLKRSEAPSIQRAAVAALSKLRQGDPEWNAEVFELAKDKAAGLRSGAAIALVQIRTPEALELLQELLADPDRSVRAEALQQVGNVRRKELIPALIGALKLEVGQAKRDVATVLRLVTGEDQGLSAQRWSAWFGKEGAELRLPSYDEALREENTRRRRRENNSTGTSFYGLQVISERVAFVVDVSGSMAERTGRGTRLDKAKEQLNAAIETLPNGTLFNLVFFSNGVFGWDDDLIVLSDKTRKEALAYVDDQRADGGTALFDGLEFALNDNEVDTIYVLSDGSPSAGRIIDPVLLREEVRTMNESRHVRIHTIFIGSAADDPQAEPLLKGLAEDSDGEFTRPD